MEENELKKMREAKEVLDSIKLERLTIDEDCPCQEYNLYIDDDVARKIVEYLTGRYVSNVIQGSLEIFTLSTEKEITHEQK